MLTDNMNIVLRKKIKFLLRSRYYAEGVTSGGIHLRGLAPGNATPKKHRSGSEQLATAASTRNRIYLK